MNKPDLLILDEPTSGLDPLVQQTVMELVREANQSGATVFFSSHILPEVQAVCDRVGIIREGQLVATERVEDLTTQHFKRIRFTFANTPPTDAFAQDGVIETSREAGSITLEISGRLDEVMAQTASFGITDIETIPVSLEEIFLAYYGKGNGENMIKLLWQELRFRRNGIIGWGLPYAFSQSSTLGCIHPLPTRWPVSNPFWTCQFIRQWASA